MGGLSKKAFMIRGLTKDANFPALVISSGNMLINKGFFSAQLDVAAITAKAVVQATRAMGGKVMGVGTLDLKAGLPLLQSFHQPPDFTLLSANLVAPESKTPLFAPVFWASAGGLHIAIIGLTDHHEVSGQTGFTILPWEDVLESTLAAVGPKADFVLLLSNYPLPENQSIARRFDQIDCILQAGHVIGNMMPIVVKNTLISQTDIRGKYVGVLDIQWNGHGRWENSTAAATEASNSTFTNRYIGLKTSMRNDPAIETLLKQAQRQIADMKQKRN